MSNYLFVNRYGGPLRNDHLNVRWKAAMRAAGLPACRQHDLRHTLGTLQRKAGTELQAIQELLRHAHIRTTAGIHVHAVPEVLREAAIRYDRLLPPPAELARAAKNGGSD